MRFFDAVIRYETDLWNHVERALKSAGPVSLADLEGLRAIHAGGETGRVHEVSRHLGVTIGAASKLVDRLERAGLAQRRANPNDGRSSFVGLTAAGDMSRLAAESVLEAAVDSLVRDSGIDVDAVARDLETLRTTLATSEVRA